MNVFIGPKKQQSPISHGCLQCVLCAKWLCSHRVAINRQNQPVNFCIVQIFELSLSLVIWSFDRLWLGEEPPTFWDEKQFRIRAFFFFASTNTTNTHKLCPEHSLAIPIEDSPKPQLSLPNQRKQIQKNGVCVWVWSEIVPVPELWSRHTLTCTTHAKLWLIHKYFMCSNSRISFLPRYAWTNNSFVQTFNIQTLRVHLFDDTRNRCVNQFSDNHSER